MSQISYIIDEPYRFIDDTKFLSKKTKTKKSFHKILAALILVIAPLISFAQTQKRQTQEATFQWLDCLNAQNQVPNATIALFTPEADGEYAVQITQGNCTDTSRCFAINGVGFADQRPLDHYYIYPNPTSANVNIDLGLHTKNVSVKISNIQGQFIREENIFHTTQSSILLPKPPGWYIITIHPQDGVPQHFKVLKM